MPKINRLPAAVSSLIAAGEVIERPASLLKELLENSLDAGARQITVEVLGAGKKSLRITDDGSGMDAEDCAACVERHATSKISALSDLDKLQTFGFRGEALYAVAAVSRMTVQSAMKNAKSGWKVDVEAGKIISSAPAPAVVGTTIEVRDLFFNTPARLKFLKSDAFEKSALSGVLEEAALANPGVHFTYKSENRTTLHFSPEDDRRRVASVLGKDVAEGLLPIVAERPGLRLKLFVSPVERMVPSRNFQYWFINKRPIGAKILQQALYRAYQEHRANGRHPVCVAFAELSPDSFDVNVHPGKREIRFKSDREIYDLVSGLIASALAKAKPATPITPETAATASQELRDHVPAYYLGGRSFFPNENLLDLKSAPTQSFAPAPASPRWFTPPYRYIGQIERSYLVFEAAGGLFVLDQHAAAERILYEKFLAQIKDGPAKVQRLMLPLPIELPASRVQAVLSQSERLAKLGFEVAAAGRTTLHVLAAPALFSKAADLKDMVHRLLDALENPLGAARDVQHDAIATLACKAAVKAHDALSPQEALRLLEDLKDCADGSCCPHGRRAILALNREELARRFQRPGAPPL